MRVLFLCTGNSCRSQMGEALLRHLSAGEWDAFSAGTHPAAAVHPLALATLAERGVPTDGLRPKGLSAFNGQDFDLLVTTCDEADQECPVFGAARARLHWSLPDPARATGTDDEVRDAFRRTADDLGQRIGELLSRTRR